MGLGFRGIALALLLAGTVQAQLVGGGLPAPEPVDDMAIDDITAKLPPEEAKIVQDLADTVKADAARRAPAAAIAAPTDPDEQKAIARYGPTNEQQQLANWCTSNLAACIAGRWDEAVPR